MLYNVLMIQLSGVTLSKPRGSLTHVNNSRVKERRKSATTKHNTGGNGIRGGGMGWRVENVIAVDPISKSKELNILENMHTLVGLNITLFYYYLFTSFTTIVNA